MTDNSDKELNQLQFESTMRGRTRSIEYEEFLRKHRDGAERNIPLAEAFVFEFADQILKPLTLEENNEQLNKLDITKEHELKLIRLVNDAFKLAKANKLAGHVETAQVSGYDASENTRGFKTNMIFLNFQAETGTNPLFGAVNAFGQFSDAYFAQKAAEELSVPGAPIHYVVTDRGVFSTNPPELVGTFSNITAPQAPRSEENFKLEHNEGEEEDQSDYDFFLMVGWDIDNSLPVFISIWGEQGLIGDNLRLRFSFESQRPGTNPFPLPAAKKEDIKVNFTNDRQEVNCEYTGYVEDEDKYYKETQKFKNLGEMNLKNGQKVNVWASNEKWNTFGPINPEAESK